MLSKLRRLCLPNLYPKLLRVTPIASSRRFGTEPTPHMYCMQCEQTPICITQGICGKWAETSNMQDLLLYVNNGLGQYMNTIDQKQLDPSLREKARSHVLDSTFSTISNVNFSEQRMLGYVQQSLDIREQLKETFRQRFPQPQEFEGVQDSPANYKIEDLDEVNEDALRLAGLPATRERIGDVNCFGLRECAVYGLKGMMTYFHHAEELHHGTQGGTYSEEERDEVYDVCFGTMNDLCSNSKDLNYWLGINMRIGATNVKVMELLDKANNAVFGTPEPTEVSATPVPGKCILISGHDLLHTQNVLNLIEKKGFDINVYTHCELLPAHAYPKLKENKRLVGHFGGAWPNQNSDFKAFPGAILMTTNCLIPPRLTYKDRLFTTGSVGFDEVKHVNTFDEKELEQMLQKALECDGFDDTSIAPFKEEKPHLTGFGHAAVLSQAETVLNAIKSGDLQHIFVIGGCDGSEATRSYFTELGQSTPENAIILTLGCGKYRLRDLELGDIGGIPRILDMGQCNDAYSAVVVAMKLAEALDTDIHHLPLHFALSWFNQDAVAILLSLLHLGVKNIRLGPVLPAFLTEDVKKYLFDNFGVQQVNLTDVKQDLNQMLAETPQ